MIDRLRRRAESQGNSVIDGDNLQMLCQRNKSFDQNLLSLRNNLVVFLQINYAFIAFNVAWPSEEAFPRRKNGSICVERGKLIRLISLYFTEGKEDRLV